MLGRPDGVSIDDHIGDPAYLGRGLGASMLDRLAPRDRMFHILHEPANRRAIRCTTRAGFAAVPRSDGEKIENGRPMRLFLRAA